MSGRGFRHLYMSVVGSLATPRVGTKGKVIRVELGRRGSHTGAGRAVPAWHLSSIIARKVLERPV